MKRSSATWYIHLLWMACLGLGHPAALQGATFYCDPVHGSPGGDGSAERPWRRAEEVLGAGKIQRIDQQGVCANPEAPVKPGDTLRLRSGWHGLVRVPTGFNPEWITLEADEGQTPQLGGILVREGRRWRFRGLTVSPSLAPAPMAKPPADLVVLAEHGDDASGELTVEDCFVYTVLETADWTADDWIHRAANGIRLGRHGRGHIARNNFVLNTRFGINLCAVDCLCEGNVVANFSGDGIRALRDGQTVQYNVIKNNFVGPEEGDDNHDDGIQAFLFNAGRGTLRGITIRENLIVARETAGLPFPNPLQGIGCFDGPLLDFVVERNVVCVDNWHGISLYDSRNCLIRDNACFSPWNSKPRPWIMLGKKREGPEGNTVRDNRAHSFRLTADARVTALNNQKVTAREFEKLQADLAARIDEKFGARHPTANRLRLEK